MASPTTTFRLTDRDRLQLSRLADELLCKRTDVLRLGMAALRESRPLRRQIKADNLARSFLQSLRAEYGEDAVIERVDGPGDLEWRLGGAPLDPSVVKVALTHRGERIVMDLIQPATGVGIHNVDSFENDQDARHAVVRLRDLWVHSAYAVIGEPTTRRTHDGRTIVSISEDDGSVRQLILDSEGRSQPLDPAVDAPIADLDDPDPSVGIGVRRESKNGPHLGRGIGGQWKLTGDVEQDRAAVVDTLEQLIERTKRGELDGILNPMTDEEGPVAILDTGE